MTGPAQVFFMAIVRSAFTASGRLAAVIFSTPFVEAGLDPALVDGVGQAQGTLEGAEASFRQVVAFGFLLALLLLLALDGEHAVAEGDGYILFLDARQIGLDRQLVAVLAHIELGRQPTLDGTSEQTREARPILLEALEHPVHLTTHGGEEIERAGNGTVSGLGYLCLCHGSLLSSWICSTRDVLVWGTSFAW